MRKLKQTFSIIVMILVLMMFSRVNAVDFSCKVNAQTDTTVIEAGKNISVDVIIDELVLSDNSPGITTIRLYLDYDKDVYEEITKAEIESMLDGNIRYIPELNQISLELDDIDSLIKTSGQKVLTIKFKVKDDVSKEKLENANINLNNVELTDNNQKVKFDSIVVEFNNEQINNISNKSTVLFIFLAVILVFVLVLVVILLSKLKK